VQLVWSFRFVSRYLVSLRKWGFINQQDLFLLSDSKRKILKKTGRELHVQLCSEFTVVLHLYHGIIEDQSGPFGHCPCCLLLCDKERVK
jgi:hypothetical protein